MVKPGSNLSDKLEKQPSADDGFDNIPLITPLEVDQLQQSLAEKVTSVRVSPHQTFHITAAITTRLPPACGRADPSNP